LKWREFAKMDDEFSEEEFENERRLYRSELEMNWRESRVDFIEPPVPTNKQLAEHWRQPESCADKCVVGMMVGLSYFYDFSAAFLSIVDVTTDALVTREFYQDGKMFFFVFSLCIMMVAHLAFAFLFIALYCGHTWSEKQRVLLWFAMMPLAQMVPIFIWVHSFEFQWFTKMLEFLGLNTDQPGTGNLHEDDDPLMTWIRKKISSHGGFIVEACIEAFPQSVLQMVSIVVYHEHTTLNVLSVIISMTAVASKKVMLSYNIDRKVFLFNFACFVGDIFNVFATVAWVFHSADKSAIVGSTLAYIWVFKLGILAALIAGYAFLHFRRWMYDVNNQCCQSWRRYFEGFYYFCKGMINCIRTCTLGEDGCWLEIEPHRMGDKIRLQWFWNCGYHVNQTPCWKYVFKRACHNFFDWILLMLEFLVLWPIAITLFLIMGAGLFIFSIMAGEIFKLGFFPLMIFGAGQEHRQAVPFYRYLFSFLQTSRNTKDCKLRLALTNQMFLERHFQNVPKAEISDPEMLILRHRQEVFCKRDPSTIKFSEMHGFNNETDGITCADCLRMVFVEGFQKNFYRWIRCECFENVEQCYFVTVLAPYDILSALFTIFLPIAFMISTPYKKWTMLQESLSFIYVFTLLIVVALSVYVYKFFRLSSSIFAPALHKTMPVVDDIIARWKDYIATKIRDDLVENYFQDLAPIVLSYAGKHRMNDTNWIPSINWKSAGQIDGVYLDWKKKKPKKIVKDVLHEANKQGTSKGIYTEIVVLEDTEEKTEVAGELKESSTSSATISLDSTEV